MGSRLLTRSVRSGAVFRHCECILNFCGLGRAEALTGTFFFPASVSVPIQHFLAWRIKHLSRRWLWFFVVSALSLGQGSCAFLGGVFASTTAKYSLSPQSCVPTGAECSLRSRTNLGSLIPIAESWISIAVLTDGEFPSPSLVW
jgi:hypothetical protein